MNLLKNSGKLNRNRKRTPRAQSIRKWSNQELRKVASQMGGDVINVSGWEDKDKQGGYYKDYFPSRKSYTVSNYTPSHSDNEETEIILDLEKKLPKNLEGKFDVVLSHTNLEHIFDCFTAIKNHCLLSRDIVIIIVPFIQQQHENAEFKDYWRYTPSCLRKMFEINGMKTVYEAYSNRAFRVNYLLFVGSKHPRKWKNKLPPYKKLSQVGKWAS